MRWTVPGAGPPEFLELVAHPLRWQLLRELTRSDRTVAELVDRLGAPQNLVSYHLRRLRDGGLVHAHRSAADGRDSYYALDLTRCASELRDTGAALHPALGPLGDLDPAVRGRHRVLFLCTGNSARSQIAEALTSTLSAGAVEAASAGSHPKALHPHAVRVMRRRGIDIAGRRTKSYDEFLATRFDLVVTLCDRVREVCPEFPAASGRAHWSVPDPAAAGDDGWTPFERTAEDLEVRVRFLLPQLRELSTNDQRRSSDDQH